MLLTPTASIFTSQVMSGRSNTLSNGNWLSRMFPILRLPTLTEYLVWTAREYFCSKIFTRTLYGHEEPDVMKSTAGKSVLGYSTKDCSLRSKSSSWAAVRPSEDLPS